MLFARLADSPSQQAVSAMLPPPWPDRDERYDNDREREGHELEIGTEETKSETEAVTTIEGEVMKITIELVITTEALAGAG